VGRKIKGKNSRSPSRESFAGSPIVIREYVVSKRESRRGFFVLGMRRRTFFMKTEKKRDKTKRSPQGRPPCDRDVFENIISLLGGEAT